MTIEFREDKQIRLIEPDPTAQQTARVLWKAVRASAAITDYETRVARFDALVRAAEYTRHREMIREAAIQAFLLFGGHGND